MGYRNRSVALVFAGLMVFLCCSCNFVSQAEFNEHTTVADELIDNVRHCETRRGTYYRRAQTCLYGLFVDDYGEVYRRLAEDGIERTSANFQKEFDRYADEFREGYCDYSCLYEAICYEPHEYVCEHMGVTVVEWREGYHDATSE